MIRDSQTRVSVNPGELRHDLPILQDIDATLRHGVLLSGAGRLLQFRLGRTENPCQMSNVIFLCE